MKTKIALVISEFNREITSNMEKTAEKYARSLGTEIVKKIHVPGALEIPFAVKKIMQSKNVNAIAVLGAVIRGKTYHDIIIVSSAAQKLMELSLQYNKPIGFGIIGPRVTWRQAHARAEEYAKRAVKSAIDMVNLLSRFTMKK